MCSLTIGSDHGQYLLFSSAFTSQQIAAAVIQSETFPATTHTGFCLTFWYIIRGTNLGRVEVSVSNRKGTTIVWSLGDIDHGESWQFASVGYYSDEEYNVGECLCFERKIWIFLYQDCD